MIYEAGETHYATVDIFFGTQNELKKERWRNFQTALKAQNIDLNRVIDNLSGE